MPREIRVNGDNVTADQLLWRLYGVRGQELVETMLILNPGLGGRGPVLPQGEIVLVPDLPPAEPVKRKLVTLFG
jgi:phage tail protein X